MDFLSYINGHYVSPSGKSTTKINPFNGEVLGTVHLSDMMELIPAVTSAKKSLSSMRETPLTKRYEWVQKVLAYTESHSDEIAYAEALHQGLPYDFVLNEVLQSATMNLERLLDFQSEAPSFQTGAGVIAIILPWVLSYKFAVEKMSRCLLAGDPCLIKASPLSPVTAQFLVKALEHAEVPESYVQVLQGDKEVALFLASHPAIAGITANSSQPALEDLAKEGLRTYKKLQLSGGVKNSGFVLSDFDLEQNFAQVMRPFLLGQGQLCFNTTRLFILEKQVELFKELAQSYFAKLTPSHDPRDGSIWTPLINQSAVERSLQRIQAGAGERGRVFLGGESLSSSGSFVSPAVMLDLTNCSELQQDDLQSPLLLVGAVKYQHEMAKWANNTYLAHSAVIWGSAEKAQKVAQQVDAELIQLNEWKVPVQSVFGSKNTGYGIGDDSWNGRFYSNVKMMTGT